MKIALILLFVLSSQISLARTNEAEKIWPKVQAAVDERNLEAISILLGELGQQFRIDNNHQERMLVTTGDLIRSLENVIRQLKKCDTALGEGNVKGWQNCRSPKSDLESDRNYISIYLDEIRDYSTELPIDRKKLFAKFDEAQLLHDQAEQKLADEKSKKRQKIAVQEKNKSVASEENKKSNADVSNQYYLNQIKENAIKEINQQNANQNIILKAKLSCMAQFKRDNLLEKYDRCLADAQYVAGQKPADVPQSTKSCRSACESQRLDLEIKCQSCRGSSVARNNCISSCQRNVSNQIDQCVSTCR